MYTFDQLAQRVHDHFVGLSEVGAREIASDYAYNYFAGTAEPEERVTVPPELSEDDVTGILMTIALSGIPEKEAEFALSPEEMAKKIVEDCEAEITAARERRNEDLRVLYEKARFTVTGLSRASGLNRTTVSAIINSGSKPGISKGKAVKGRQKRS